MATTSPWRRRLTSRWPPCRMSTTSFPMPPSTRCAAATVLTPLACSRPPAATRAFRCPDPWSHPAAVWHPIRHSVPLRTRSGSLSHTGRRGFIISTVVLMMAAELETLLGRAERPRSYTLMDARGPSTSSCTHNPDPGLVPLPGFGLGGGGQDPTGSPGLSTTSRRSQRCTAAAREPSPSRPHTACPGASPSLSRLHVGAAARALVGSSDAASRQGPGRPTRALRPRQSRRRRCGGRTRRDFHASRLGEQRFFTLSFKV